MSTQLGESRELWRAHKSKLYKQLEMHTFRSPPKSITVGSFKKQKKTEQIIY